MRTIRVEVLVPHDHMARFARVDLVDTEDVRRRIRKGFLIEIEDDANGGDEDE